MDISQMINHINENNYDDDITVTDIPKGHFIAVVSSTVPEGSNTREIGVHIIPLDQAQLTTQTINSGLFVRKEGENEIKVTVSRDGEELGTNIQAYS